MGIISSHPLVFGVDTSVEPLLPLLPGPYDSVAPSTPLPAGATTASVIANDDDSTKTNKVGDSNNGASTPIEPSTPSSIISSSSPLSPTSQISSSPSSTSPPSQEWSRRWLNATSAHIMLPNGRLLRVVNCHLHYKPYGPYIIMDAIKAKRTSHPNDMLSVDDEMMMSSGAVTESDQTQGADMSAILYQLVNQPSPVPHKDTDTTTSSESTASAPTTLVMGDFNLCSHLDWNGSVLSSPTATTPSSSSSSSTVGSVMENKVSSVLSSLDDNININKDKQSLTKEWLCSPPREYGLHCPVAWPVSTKLHAHGFEDTYRVVNTDSHQSPGYTWPALTEKQMGFPVLDDRIDFIYIRPPAPPSSPSPSTTEAPSSPLSSSFFASPSFSSSPSLDALSPTSSSSAPLSSPSSSSSSSVGAPAALPSSISSLSLASSTSSNTSGAQRLISNGVTIKAARRVGADVGDWPIDDTHNGWPSDHYAVSISLIM